MSGNFPFGFTPPDPDKPGGDPTGGFDMSQLGSALESLGRMLQSGETGPVNWDLASQMAKQHEAQQSDPELTAGERSAVADAAMLADHWLDGACSFAASDAGAVAWTRREWVDGTLPTWQEVITPVAEQVQGTLGGLIAGQAMPGMDEQAAAMMGPLAGMAKQLGAALFAAQVGQGLGTLSGEVLSASDIGIPLTRSGRPTILPGNAGQFADGLGLDRQDVLLYVALRECAHERLFTHVPWLRSRLEAAVAAYARGIHVDTDRIEQAVAQIDPANPESMQEVLSGGVLEPQDTPEQRAALSRLETLLAMVEGWVEHVVTEAVADRMPDLGRLSEAMRRRRAAGGPAEKTFATLVGLELRPRRLREAAQFWGMVLTAEDAAGRDALWEHPDLLPAADDLDDIDGYWERRQSSEPLQVPEDPGAAGE
ncbi:MAG: zinc-dependent metalloprotease [Candidatus Nanopelagicales bacterium]|nr:zinc-dependent metalloprotease [Candidatus Nanopelagicales bacterium]MDZ4249883.1 zinc-dependent metalloprotease [Candidatus Nanopelagicales bacterium]